MRQNGGHQGSDVLPCRAEQERMVKILVSVNDAKYRICV